MPAAFSGFLWSIMTLEVIPSSVPVRRSSLCTHWLSRYIEGLPCHSVCILSCVELRIWYQSLCFLMGRMLACAFFQDFSPGWSLPIKAMIQSLPLWAIIVSYFCEYWLFNIIMAYTPTYISSVLQASPKDVSTEKAHSVMFDCIITQSSVLHTVTKQGLDQRPQAIGYKKYSQVNLDSD